MILKLVAIKDVKVGAFQQPACVAAVGAAERAFSDAVSNPNKDTDISRHPEDFELYILGEFNDENGAINAYTTPTFLMGGKNVQK